MRLSVRLVCLVLLFWPRPAWAFHADGHFLATEMAVGAVADKLPAFFAAGARTIAQSALDPDYLKDQTTPQLRDAEYPEHYTQWPALKDMELPPTRYEFLELCAQRKLRPREVGTLPHALAEWTQRLTLALAEHRKWPGDPAIQQKCLLYAGFLAHYAQDACNPLHVTADFDGRTRTDGSSPRTGIHFQVDALIGKVPVQRGKEGLPLPPGAIRPAAFAQLMPSLFDQLRRSHGLADQVYGMEKDLLVGAPAPRTDPALSGPFFLVDVAAKLERQVPPEGAGAPRLPDNPRLVAFAQERLSACAAFTAALYLTAWQDSAKVQVPAWLDKGAAPATAPLNSPTSGPAGAATSRPAAAGQENVKVRKVME